MQLFDLGNEAYNQGLYEKAKNFYVKVLDENLHSAELYFNLGNSYYRMQDIGQAIWAYKNAIRLNPRDKDIAHNLKVAEANKIDRIKSPPLFIFHEYYRKIKLT